MDGGGGGDGGVGRVCKSQLNVDQPCSSSRRKGGEREKNGDEIRTSHPNNPIKHPIPPLHLFLAPDRLQPGSTVLLLLLADVLLLLLEVLLLLNDRLLLLRVVVLTLLLRRHDRDRNLLLLLNRCRSNASAQRLAMKPLVTINDMRLNLHVRRAFDHACVDEGDGSARLLLLLLELGGDGRGRRPSGRESPLLRRRSLAGKDRRRRAVCAALRGRTVDRTG